MGQMNHAQQVGWRSGPRTISDIVDGSINLYRRHFGRLLGITAVVYVPVSIVYLALWYLLWSTLSKLEGGWNSDILGHVPTLATVGVAVAVGFSLAVMIAQAALTWAVSEIYLGTQVSIGTAYRHVLSRFWPLLGTTALATLVIGLPLTPGLAVVLFGATDAVFVIIGGGLLLLGSIPSLVLGVLFALVVPVVVVEDRAYTAALARSRQLVGGHFWRVVGVFVVLGLLVQAVSCALVAPVSVLAIGLFAMRAVALPIVQTGVQAVGGVTTLLLTPLQLIGSILVYYDLRIRKEGFDLDRMAAELEAAG